MKKLLSILLTVVMVFSVSSAFAYERGEYEATPVPVTITSANTLDVTRQFDENKESHIHACLKVIKNNTVKRSK